MRGDDAPSGLSGAAGRNQLKPAAGFPLTGKDLAQLRAMVRLSRETVAEKSAVGLVRLARIEGGASPTLAELSAVFRVLRREQRRQTENIAGC
jgi:predicted transcriptional regulator